MTSKLSEVTNKTLKISLPSLERTNGMDPTHTIGDRRVYTYAGCSTESCMKNRTAVQIM